MLFSIKKEYVKVPVLDPNDPLERSLAILDKSNAIPAPDWNELNSLLSDMGLRVLDKNGYTSSQLLNIVPIYSNYLSFGHVLREVYLTGYDGTIDSFIYIIDRCFKDVDPEIHLKIEAVKQGDNSQVVLNICILFSALMEKGYIPSLDVLKTEIISKFISIDATLKIEEETKLITLYNLTSILDIILYCIATHNKRTGDSIKQFESPLHGELVSVCHKKENKNDYNCILFEKEGTTVLLCSKDYIICNHVEHKLDISRLGIPKNSIRATSDFFCVPSKYYSNVLSFAKKELGKLDVKIVGEEELEDITSDFLHQREEGKKDRSVLSLTLPTLKQSQQIAPVSKLLMDLLNCNLKGKELVTLSIQLNQLHSIFLYERNGFNTKNISDKTESVIDRIYYGYNRVIYILEKLLGPVLDSMKAIKIGEISAVSYIDTMVLNYHKKLPSSLYLDYSNGSLTEFYNHDDNLTSKVSKECDHYHRLYNLFLTYLLSVNERFSEDYGYHLYHELASMFSTFTMLQLGLLNADKTFITYICSTVSIASEEQLAKIKELKKQPNSLAVLGANKLRCDSALIRALVFHAHKNIAINTSSIKARKGPAMTLPYPLFIPFYEEVAYGQ